MNVGLVATDRRAGVIAETAHPLAETAMTTLRAFFDTKNHRPSGDHWRALRAIAETMEDMAEGTCPAEVFLSAVDPGVGKTQTVAHFTRALVASPRHRDRGVVICVGRLAEAEAFAKLLDIPDAKLALLTSNTDLNALGGADVDAAQVLITTQQRIERAAGKDALFADTPSFYFNGAPRAVRVWDEAWLPGVAVTIGQDDLLFLVKLVRQLSAAFADNLMSFSGSLGKKANGELVEVPDFEAAHGVSLDDVLASTIGSGSTMRDDQRAAATSLRLMNGKTVKVAKDGPHGSTILTYQDTLPADLVPLLVLDASGRVRDTYRQIEAHRGGLVRLPTAVKDYSPLTVQMWRTGGSKTAFTKNNPNRRTLVDCIASTVATKPTERWLVVVHRPNGRVGDVKHDIDRRLPAAVRANVQTITWGQHMATNAYADMPNVILAGTLFMANSFYTALTHLVRDQPVASGTISRDQITQTMRGEHANLVLQALCRGRVRKSAEAKCQPMTAYVIAAAKSGIPADLPAIFPGCKVLPWGPQQAPSGNVKKALTYLRKELISGVEWIAHSAIYRAIKMDRSNFAKDVLRSPQWTEATAAMCLEVCRGPGRGLGLKLANVVLGS